MTPERLAFLRGPAGGGRMLTAEECRELCDAYERMAISHGRLRASLSAIREASGEWLDEAHAVAYGLSGL